MKKLIYTLLIASICLQCSTNNPPAATGSLESRVDSLVHHYLDSGKIAGAAVAVVRGSEMVLLKSYGHADLSFKVPMPVDASFEIGSVTKQFTGAAILQLAEAGKLSLDDEVTRYIPFNTQGKKVTIRQLLSHTSGIKGYTELPFFRQLSISHFKRDTLLRLVEKEPYDFEPGEALIYNNTGFFMLGLIIEKVSGETYEAYVKKNLFDKAGMNNSHYCSESKVISKKAYGYDTDKDGLVKAAYLDHLWPYAAGSLCSTVEDLIRWNEALHHGKIFNEASYTEMITPVKLNDGTATRYAKGLGITESNGVRKISHGGGINGFLSDNVYFPASNVSIVVLFNTAGPVGPDIVSDFIAGAMGVSTPEAAIPFDGSTDPLTGTYTGRGRGRDLSFTIEKSGNGLTTRRGDGKPRELKYTRQGWMDGESLYYFSEGKLDIDTGGGYYRLVKEK